MPNPPWRHQGAQRDGDPAANGRTPDERTLNEQVTGERAAEERGERAKAAGTGEVEKTDVRVAGPPPEPVRRTGGPRPEPRMAEDEVATSFPAPAAPRHGRPHDEHPERFMDQDAAARLRERWRDVQSGFVDDPREAVRKADELAAEALTALGESLREHRRGLEGDGADTERLRLALRRYRDFLDHMLSI